MLWYLRRAVPWPPVLAATGLAVVLLAVALWYPTQAPHVLRFALAAAAAAAAFVLDEPAAAVVDAAPHGPRWRTAARLIALTVPYTIWVGGVLAIEMRTPNTSALGLLLEGAGAVLAAAATAGVLRHRGHPTPGDVASAAVALIVVAFVLFDPFPGTLPVFPDTTGWEPSSALWAAITAAAAVALLLVASGTPHAGR